MRWLFGRRVKKEPDLIVGAEVLEVHLDVFRYIVRLDSGAAALRGEFSR